MPGRITTFSNDDNLFAYNVVYPVADNLPEEIRPICFGIRNIGKGPANNVRVLNFRSEEEHTEVFGVGSNVIRIPEETVIPFTLRIAINDKTKFPYVTYTTTISYEDLFGNTFYLSIRLWINDTAVAAIEYNDKKNPKWKEFVSVVWREVEGSGYFETREIEKRLSKGHSTNIDRNGL